MKNQLAKLKPRVLYLIQIYERAANPEVLPSWSAPCLVSAREGQPEYMVWGLGPSYTMMPDKKDLKIIKQWPFPSENKRDLYDFETDCIVEKFKMFPPKPMGQTVQCDGWLSPEGKFYGCNYMEHESLAVELMCATFGVYGNRFDLFKKGYIQFHKAGWPLMKVDCVTKKQIAHMKAMSRVGDKEWRSRVREFLVNHEEGAVDGPENQKPKED